MNFKNVSNHLLNPKKMMAATLLALSLVGGAGYATVSADEKPQTRVVIGEDTRQLITDFTNQPYRATVKMIVRFPDGSRVVGTGVLVADDFVVTSAHVVYDETRGGRAVAAEVTAGSGSAQNIGVVRADGEDHFFSATNYTKGYADHDLGGIKLDGSLSSAGKLEIQETISANETLRLSGYKGIYLYTSTGTINSLSTDKVAYTMDSEAGTSGGSVVNSNNKLVAIHHGGTTVTNSAARLTGSNLTQLKSWMGEDDKDWVELSAANFPDVEFRDILSQRYPEYIENGKIHVSAFTRLELSPSFNDRVNGKNISDLKGIEYFKNLTTLYCSGNRLTTLDVSKLTKLEKLICDNNKLISLDVSNLTNLVYLWCDYNQLTSLDVSNLSKLEEIFYQSQAPNFDLIGWYSEESWVELSAKNFPDENFRKYLQEEYAKYYIEDMKNGKINVEVLEYIHLENSSKVKNLTGIEVFKNLHGLSIYKTEITSVSVSNFEKLHDLEIEGNDKLTHLDISNLPELEYLRFCENNFTGKLVVSNLPVLWSFDCDNNNQLPSLEVSNCPELNNIYCENNKLSSLVVSNLPKLAYLVSGNNQLTSLDVSNLPELRRLSYDETVNVTGWDFDAYQSIITQ
ncbi:hypothetical protein Hs30E_18940 [Lactococcus hodotermopsidis]|uniref:Serine protease n=1 Tax=Pseudolactococcus hodotermopsidis TaxID=2709157 RepID=A0A6A0BF64_9LACT|nr:trypsin-like peptidase domain-containing protein [Lactococcus hodotermopsidis]GFH43343.1 hypothetical protein Hs30E_18940 [Lactococcus hodotermopsidis]